MTQNKLQKQLEDKGVIGFVFFALRKALVAAVAWSIFVCIWLLKPIVHFRFGSLFADKIGPLVSLPGLYLLEKDHKVQPQKTVDVFHNGYGINKHVCNRQLLKMYRRIFKNRPNVILNEQPAKLFFDFFRKKEFAQDFLISTTKHGRDILGLIEQSDVYLEFTEDEIAQAENDLRKIGIPKDAPYVCLINRDQKYLTATFPDKDWYYQSFRNCSIDNYSLAVKELIARGYYVIRMGAVVGEPLDVDDPKVIDYAFKGLRTELLDIYLAANCKFFIGCNSGLDAVPWFFQRPEVYVNVSDLEYLHSWVSNTVMIFKKYWLKGEQRYMTLQEIANTGAGQFNYREEYDALGIELIENTPEEIATAIDEHDQRLKGTWQAEEGDEELQKQFWSYFQSSEQHGVIRSRIGAQFLRENKEALGLQVKQKVTV